MNRKKQIIKKLSICICIIFIVGLTLILIYNDKNYYNDVLELNRNLDADGLKLMMTIEEVNDIYGKEESFYENFWWSTYEYPSKGIGISTSRPQNYDLYNKVNGISISNKEFSVFGIFLGIDESKVSDILLKWGYKEKVIDYSQDKVYEKGCITIYFSIYEKVVVEIDVSVTDKKFNPREIPDYSDLITNEELNNRAKELIDCNIEAISIFYQDSLPYDSEQSEGLSNSEKNEIISGASYGNIYTVKSEKYITFEDLSSFVYSTYKKEYADKLLFTWIDDKPMYLDVKGKLYVDSSKVGSSGYYIIWDNYTFQITNISEKEANIKIFLKEIEIGTDNITDITKEGKLVNQNGEWVLDKSIW